MPYIPLQRPDETEYQRTIDALERGGYGPGKLAGKETRFRCPAHDDQTPSLDVFEARDGKALLQCRSHQCDPIKIFRALNIGHVSNGHVSNGHVSTNGNGNASRKIVAIYDYRDETGALLYQTVRYDPKTFRQRRPDGNGGWIWNLDGVRCVPYRLPELLAAPPDATVFIEEGEKDADSLAALGLIATTSPMGAGKWSKLDRATVVAGFSERHVAILPDNDEAGRNHGNDAVDSLLGTAESIAILNLPGLPDKGDVSDWLIAGGTAAELQRVADAADRIGDGWTRLAGVAPTIPTDDEMNRDRYGINPDGTLIGDGDGKRKPVYAPRLYTSAEFFATEFRREFLVRGVLVKGQPAVVGGAKKMLKSGIGIDLAVSLDTATPFLGFERFAVRERCNVLLINGESGESTIQETAGRIANARGLTRHDLKILWSADLPQLANIQHLYDLADILRTNRIGFVGIDPTYLCLLAGIGPNGPQASNLFDMGAIYSLFARYCLEAGATPCLFSHCKKGRSNEPPDLDDLAFSGIAEFARQWLLLSRREPYQGDGQHRLWLNVGGSAGHSFLGHLDVDEGVMDDDFRGKRWEPVVTPFGEVAKERKRGRDENKAAERTADEQSTITLIDNLVSGGEVATLTRIRNGSEVSRTRTDGALERLRQKRLVEEFPAAVKSGNKAGTPASAYRRRPE